MSAVPPEFNPQASFSTLAQQPITSTGLPGSELDGEFSRAADSINQIKDRLSEIQRDDGKLRNGVVSSDSLSDELKNLFISSGVKPVTWAIGSGFAVGDLVSNPPNTPGTYLCIAPHTSSSVFVNDLVNWALIAAPPSAGVLYTNTFTGNGTTTNFTLTDEPVSIDSTQVFIDGIYQPKSGYVIDGALLTISPAPAINSDVEVVIGVPSTSNIITVADGAISSAKLGTNAVTSPKMASFSVTETKIADAAVSSVKLVDSAVSTAKLADGAVSTAKLGLLSVNTDRIANDSITNAKLAPLSVSFDKINNNAITTAKITSNAITTEKISDLSVITSKIANGAIDSSKLTDGAVVSDKISNSAIISSKITESAVTTEKIANASITAEKLSGAQLGTAPIYGIRAWFAMKSYGSARNSDGKTLAINNNSSGVCTITYNNHGFKTGHRFWFQFSSLITSKVYEITKINDNSFTVQTTYLTATTAPTVSIALYSSLGSGNINSISSYNSLETNPASLIVNLNEPMPNNNYAIIGLSGYSYPNLDDTDTSPSVYAPTPSQSVNSFRIYNNGTARYINVAVIG